MSECLDRYGTGKKIAIWQKVSEKKRIRSPDVCVLVVEVSVLDVQTLGIAKSRR
jgi:hypothetical protein